MNIALVCLAKNEDHYMNEWLEYHLKLGISKFFIYQNNWRYTGKYKDAEFLKLFEWDGIQRQLEAYNKFIQENYKNFDWACFIDSDEFIVLKNYSNLSDFLENYNDYEAVGLNWSVIGSCGLHFEGDYSVVKRFTKCRKKLCEQIKCFVNFNKSQNTLSFNDTPHNISQKDKTISVDKSHFINTYCDYDNENDRDIAFINHYYTKTPEEWKDKIARGWRGSMGRFIFERTLIKLYDERNTPEYNEYEDLTAYNFMYKGD